MPEYGYKVYSGNHLAHSSGPWKKHKYIKKEGNRYYYSVKGNPKAGGSKDLSSLSDRELKDGYTDASARASASYDEMSDCYDRAREAGLKDTAHVVRGEPISDTKMYFGETLNRVNEYNRAQSQYQKDYDEKIAYEKEITKRGRSRYDTAKQILGK